ncbi:radical SAM protein [Pseudophaeobacter arcticus]|uniref:radical SAM protein n=1 Tax=Pseudophaeobacter arcticus TaxID=385492 RepID=UPI0003F7C475|nr:radical SAM protein [Pseudophaeobacter arcticus]
MCQESQLAKLGLFDAKVPRYTSYPTAAHFGPQIGAAHFQSWLGQVPAGSQISLYVHIPFCRTLCWFCMCRTQGTRSDAPISAYVAALKQEISLLRSHLPKDLSLSRIHWGGGTPTILPPEMIRDLAAALCEIAPLAPGAEFLVEIDPNEFDQARCEALIDAGLTRASIGVQGFDDTTQQAIGRSLTFDRVAQVVAMLRHGGVQDLSTDLLFGLPNQTLAQIRQSTRQLLSLTPDRVALYGYKHLPAMIRRQTMIPSETLPKPEDRLELFRAARAICLEDGYQQIGLDSFARPGDSLIHARETQDLNQGLKRGFQGYDNDPAEVLIGLGASAVSRFPQGYAQNASSTAHYMAAIKTGCLASARGHAFAGEDHLRGRIIQALLCGFAIPRAQILAPCPEMAARFDTLVTEACAAFPGILVETTDGAVVTEQAQAITRVIARHFDAYEAVVTDAQTGTNTDTNTETNTGTNTDAVAPAVTAALVNMTPG